MLTKPYMDFPEEWANRQLDACTKLGIDISAAAKYKQWMIDAGFENVTELRYKWPIGPWPKDPKQKKLGMLTILVLRVSSRAP